MAQSPLTTGISLAGIDPTFDYVCFLFGPNRQNKDYSDTHQYADYAEMEADYKRRGTITVNTSFSEHTIFGAPSINHAFRYWHDLCHIRIGAPFTIAGEYKAAELQQSMVRALQGPKDADKERWCALIDCEVNGQGEYYLQHGTFPDDQRAFAVEYLKAKGWDVSSFPRTLDDLTIAY